MLLPSAFACEGPVAQESRAQRPKLPSFAPYQPQISMQPRASPIASSCRALHAILGGTTTTPQSTIQIQRRALDNPFMPLEQPFHTRPIPQPPQRGANKRRRSEFEEDLITSESIDINMEDSQCTPRPVRTPKRRRRIPLAMPLGLSAEDFRALESPLEEEDLQLDMPIVSPHITSDQDSAYGSSPSLEDSEWTIDDDRLLVETVLEKLKLSKRDWNDCARKLGKDKDSLGRRWSVLVSEGDVGLRRGGKMLRTNLDISSW